LNGTADISEVRREPGSPLHLFSKSSQGTLDKNALRVFSSSSPVISDSIKPGAMTFVLIFRDPISLAIDLVNPMIRLLRQLARPAFPKTPTTELKWIRIRLLPEHHLDALFRHVKNRFEIRIDHTIPLLLIHSEQ
jgi:hypothetical protein